MTLLHGIWLLAFLDGDPEKVQDRFCRECKKTQALMFYIHGPYESHLS